MDTKRCVFLAVVISFSFLVLPSCGGDQSEVDAFRPALEDYYLKGVAESCTFTVTTFPSLFGKPEFEKFRGKTLCDGKVLINAIHTIGPDTVHAEIRIAFQGNREMLRNIIKAWDALKERLRTLKPELLPRWNGRNVYVYLDPSDGEVFVCDQDKPQDIFESPQWRNLEDLKAFFTARLTQGEWESETMTVTLLRDNGEWRVLSEEQREDSTTQGETR